MPIIVVCFNAAAAFLNKGLLRPRNRFAKPELDISLSILTDVATATL